MGLGLRLADRLFREHGTTLFRRTLLAFIIFAVIGAASMPRNGRHDHPTVSHLIGWGLVTGLAGAFAVLLLQMKAALWEGGVVSKFFAVLLFLVGLLLLVAVGGYIAAQ